MSAITWSEYRADAKKYRMEYTNKTEYIAILLLGIAEELKEYRRTVYNGESNERQMEEFGDLLWNIAELENILSEIDNKHCVESDGIPSLLFCVMGRSVETVRKDYLRDKDYEKLYSNAREILSACQFFYVCSNFAPYAMESSVLKMWERYNVND